MNSDPKSETRLLTFTRKGEIVEVYKHKRLKYIVWTYLPTMIKCFWGENKSFVFSITLLFTTEVRWHNHKYMSPLAVIDFEG